MKIIITVLFCLILSGCSLIEITEVHQDAKEVRMYDGYEHVEACRYVREVIGTEGSWYNYLFISNKDLTQGAVNDLKNGVLALNANTVHVHTNMGFATSVTILGQAYQCKPTQK